MVKSVVLNGIHLYHHMKQGGDQLLYIYSVRCMHLCMSFHLVYNLMLV